MLYFGDLWCQEMCKKCVIYMKEHDLSTQTTEDVIRIYAAEYTWPFILPNTEPDICDL